MWFNIKNVCWKKLDANVLNPFHVTGFFLYVLKNHRFSDLLRRIEREPGMKWVNPLVHGVH